MRKVLYVCIIPALIFLFQTENLSAQSERSLKFALNVAPSINWMKSRTPSWESTKSNLGLNFGLQTDIALKANSSYYVSTGLGVSSIGGQMSYPSVYNDGQNLYASRVHSNLRLNYLDIPLGLKLRTGEIGYSRFAGWAGIGAGFNIGASDSRTIEYGSNSYTSQLGEHEEDISTEVRKSLFSFRLGLEWEKKISGETYFTFGATYNHALHSIFTGRAYQTDGAGMTDFEKLDATAQPNGALINVQPRSLVLHLGIYF
jgi:hypothetical protein